MHKDFTLAGKIYFLSGLLYTVMFLTPQFLCGTDLKINFPRDVEIQCLGKDHVQRYVFL